MRAAYRNNVLPMKCASDADLLNGSHGVFASDWISARVAPKDSGNYLVVVRYYQPIIALYVEGAGWDLTDTEHVGLEESIVFWMKLPEIPLKKIQEAKNGER